MKSYYEKGARVKNLTEISSHYTDNITKFAEMVYGVTKEVTRMGRSMIEEEMEKQVTANIPLFVAWTKRGYLYLKISLKGS